METHLREYNPNFTKYRDSEQSPILAERLASERTS
ncbi:MAG: hypothetical protein ACI9BD_000707 [Candidatus Marinamargulisbacteria bacterium]